MTLTRECIDRAMRTLWWAGGRPSVKFVHPRQKVALVRAVRWMRHVEALVGDVWAPRWLPRRLRGWLYHRRHHLTNRRYAEWQRRVLR